MGFPGFFLRNRNDQHMSHEVRTSIVSKTFISIKFNLNTHKIQTSNMTQDPERLFSFYSRATEVLAISPLMYLVATTTLKCSVQIYDSASKTPLVQMKSKLRGTALA